MPNTLYTFRLSPFGRLTELAAKIYDVDTKVTEINLTNVEHMTPEYIAIHPKHQVPAFSDDGKIVIESADICRYFEKNFNKTPAENDHWYPSDAEKRAKVDEEFVWIGENAGTIAIACLAQVFGVNGSPWRNKMGIAAVKASQKMKKKVVRQDFLDAVKSGTDMLTSKNVEKVEDLTLGDVLTWFVLSMPVFMLKDDADVARIVGKETGFYRVFEALQKVSGFNDIHARFMVLVNQLNQVKDDAVKDKCCQTPGEIMKTIKLVMYFKKHGIELPK